MKKFGYTVFFLLGKEIDYIKHQKKRQEELFSNIFNRLSVTVHVKGTLFELFGRGDSKILKNFVDFFWSVRVG